MRKELRRYALFVGSLLALVVFAAPVNADEQLYLPDALIIPMDTTYQDSGMLEAYGLVYELLRGGIPVDWVIAPDKAYGDVDFNATTQDLQTQLPVDDHGYRGGPFVVEAAYYADALPVVQTWQVNHPLVSVHRATAAFTGEVARRLLVAPNIAVFADQSEEIAFGYLNAAGIPMSDGSPWPDKQDNSGEYPCPGEKCCPDCINESEAAGPTTADHTDGALFDSDGTPRYCQFMSMHYKAPASTPEVVSEVREYLQYPVHFLAECQAVNAFENGPDGRFLTNFGLLAGHGSNNVDYFQSDDPFAQADGGYKNPGGSEPAFSLDVGSSYHDTNVVMVSRRGSAPGVDDIWMNGYVDADPTKGKVSYLGGHKHQTRLPISSNPETQGTRYFLNSLFEAPCATDEGQPDVSTWIDGPGGTNANTETVSVCYDNTAPGIAFNAALVVTLPFGAMFVSATNGGTPLGDTVTWGLGSLAADVSACVDVTVSFDSEGSYGFTSTLTYNTGVNSLQVASGPPVVVRYGRVNLLRYGGVVRLPDQLPPNSAIFIEQYPVDPALDPARDTEVIAFQPALPFPDDVADLLPGAPPLVFYELEGEALDTLRATRVGAKLVITY